MQKELYMSYLRDPKYATDGVMSYHQFIEFLESHYINQTDSMFDSVEVIEEIYYKMKLKRGFCSGAFKSLTCFRDLSYELLDVKQLLDPNYQESSALSVISILDTSYGI